MTTSNAGAESAPFMSLDWLLLITTAGLWGGSFLFMDIALDSFEPGLVTFVRVLFGCITLWAIPLDRNRVETKDRPRIAILGIVWVAFPLTMFPIAQQWIDSSLTGMLNGGTPIFVALIAIVAFATPPIRIQLTGIAIGLIGVVLIGLPQASAAGTTAVGIMLVLLALASYGVAVNIAGPLQRTYGALPVLRRALTVAVVLTIPYGLIDATRSSFGWRPLLSCLILGVGGTGIAFVTMATLAGRTGAVRASVVTYIIPLVSIALGVGFRGDSLSGWAVLGTVIVLVGARVATLGSASNKHQQPTYAPNAQGEPSQA